ncbi:hypothetical protein HMPREF0083_01566 [Aneurinibacillus aneurinilyticus ATCC 12856]|uniref:Uncharacterized protein n=1 Tax=Aneurinibacillus aneurinilyticus ATCC 12856 TaxID=649747 RepID=U1X5W0_ANEAE|nr:hypothetical protein HMPREF0083_01566 [Aneurinibacillus aneurinilyticus ATCC 12856]
MIRIQAFFLAELNIKRLVQKETEGNMAGNAINTFVPFSSVTKHSGTNRRNSFFYRENRSV